MDRPIWLAGAILPPTEREKQKGPGETAGALSSHFLRGQGNRI